MIVEATTAAKVLGWLRDPAHRKWVVAAITVALIIATVLAIRHYRTEAVEARVDAEIAEAGVETLDQARRTDNKVQANLEQSKAAIRTREEEHRVATEDALQHHQDWANQPVPDDVLRSLRD